MAELVERTTYRVDESACRVLIRGFLTSLAQSIPAPDGWTTEVFINEHSPSVHRLYTRRNPVKKRDKAFEHIIVEVRQSGSEIADVTVFDPPVYELVRNRLAELAVDYCIDLYRDF